MKDLSIEIRLRNNRLLARREELGLTQRELAAAAGLSPPLYGQLETMRLSPVQTRSARGPLPAPRWRPAALAVAGFYDCDPSELFPQFALSGREPVIRIERDEDELGLLVGQASMDMLESPEDAAARRELRERIDEALEALTPNERKVVERHFGLDGKDAESCDEIGAELHPARYVPGKVSRGQYVPGRYINDPSKTGLSRERVRQIEAKALRKIRKTGLLDDEKEG